MVGKALIMVGKGESAVHFYRLRSPYEYIKRLGYNVDICTVEEIKDIQSYDVIHFHANWLMSEGFRQMFDLLKCKKIMDIDDYWELPKTNPYYTTHFVKFYIKYFSKVDVITTTTEIFRRELLKYNKNVVVLPNCMDLSLPQYKQIDKTSDRLRVGIVGGASHYYDLKVIEGFVNGLKLDKIQLVLAGFNVDGEKYPQFSIWNQFEQLITNDYSILDERQINYLASYNKEDYPFNTCYRRIFSRQINEYATLFNEIDVLLTPLEDNKFNRMKSELKAIEAGTFNKVFLASNVGAYSKFKNEALLFDNYKANKQVTKHINNLLDKDYRDELAYLLAKRIEKDFNIEKITEKRLELWK